MQIGDRKEPAASWQKPSASRRRTLLCPQVTGCAARLPPRPRLQRPAPTWVWSTHTAQKPHLPLPTPSHPGMLSEAEVERKILSMNTYCCGGAFREDRESGSALQVIEGRSKINFKPFFFLSRVSFISKKNLTQKSSKIGSESYYLEADVLTYTAVWVPWYTFSWFLPCITLKSMWWNSCSNSYYCCRGAAVNERLCPTSAEASDLTVGGLWVQGCRLEWRAMRGGVRKTYKKCTSSWDLRMERHLYILSLLILKMKKLGLFLTQDPLVSVFLYKLNLFCIWI